ncbi:putative reverse transcriptase domain-containing protein [Tanacetum coccineum]
MTPESSQAMIDQALLRNSTNGDGSHSSHEDNRRNVQTARILIVKMESVFNISGCAIENQVKIASCHSWLMSKKLEIELWNLKVKGNDVPAYTERFQELTLICTKPKTLDETIELANDLMDQKLRTYTKRQSYNKRKADDSSRNNHGHQQQTFKRQNVAKVYNMGIGERKALWGIFAQKGNGSAPKGNGCFECGAPEHFKRDCPKLKNKDGGNGNAQG